MDKLNLRHLIWTGYVLSIIPISAVYCYKEGVTISNKYDNKSSNKYEYIKKNINYKDNIMHAAIWPFNLFIVQPLNLCSHIITTAVLISNKNNSSIDKNKENK